MSDAGDVPSLADLPATAQRVALAYYEAGLDHGYDLGYRAAQAQQERAWAAFAQLARAATAAVPYDELCERRGETDRADRQRQLMRERGITTGGCCCGGTGPGWIAAVVSIPHGD